MKITKLIKLSKNHFLSSLAEFFYLKTNLDLTRPSVIYGIITNRCNSKCLYCHYWRISDHSDEMTIEQWQNAALSLKKFVGDFSINFSGGEPFLKPGFFDLLSFLKNRGIKAGVTTNGSMLLTEDLAEKFTLTEPFNLNISCESIDPAIHDYIRAWPGLHEKLMATASQVTKAKRKLKIDFPLIMKVTINALNFRQIIGQVGWAEKNGFTGISFQPIAAWTEEAKKLEIEKKDYEELTAVINQLIKMKRAGAPILNSESNLKMFTPYFKKQAVPENILPCKVGLKNFFIYPNGDIHLCTSMPPVGNIKTDSAKKIWYGPEAKLRRRQTINCRKFCASVCSTNKSILEKVKTALKLFRK